MQAAGPRALRCSTAVIVINTRVHGGHTHTHARAEPFEPLFDVCWWW